LTETFERELVQRINRNFLDIQILKLNEKKPMWGYRIMKYIEENYSVTLRHGVLYPLLNELEQKGFLTSEKERQNGRTRRVYSVTQKGKRYLEAYRSVLKEQIHH